MLNYIHWNIDPEIFKIGSIAIRYYSVLFVSGLIISFYLLQYLFNREKISLELLDKLFFYSFFGIILGARVGHCVFYEWFYFKDHILEIFIPFKEIDGSYIFTGFQGLASHGAGIGIIISMYIFSKLNHLNFLSILDKLAINTPLAGAFIRLGNFMNSEIIGKPTDSNFGIVFEHVDNIPRHPAQLYEALAYFVIFTIIISIYLKYKNKTQTGFFAGLFLVLTFTARFFIEFIKANQETFEQDMSINMGQWLSIPFVIIGLILMSRTLFIKKQ